MLGKALVSLFRGLTQQQRVHCCLPAGRSIKAQSSCAGPECQSCCRSCGCPTTASAWRARPAAWRCWSLAWLPGRKTQRTVCAGHPQRWTFTVSKPHQAHIRQLQTYTIAGQTGACNQRAISAQAPVRRQDWNLMEGGWSVVMQVAFGDGGTPSKALQGFCKKNGVSPADVTVEADEKGTEYVWAVVRETGRSAAEVRLHDTAAEHLSAANMVTVPVASWAPHLLRPRHATCT